MADDISAAPSSEDDSGTGSGTEGGRTSVPHSFERKENSDPFSIDLDDLDDYGSGSRSSFPSIHFTRSDMKDEKDEDEDDSDDAFANLFTSEYADDAELMPAPIVPRTLYIQMVSSKLCGTVAYTHPFAGICGASDFERGMLESIHFCTDLVMIYRELLRDCLKRKPGGCSTKSWKPWCIWEAWAS